MDKWFSEGITKWYKFNKRDLPWRKEKDPYKIWLSEIILQQTQVKQGLSYYLKFAANYPTIKHLARASEDEVLKDWQGLGYYSRARNMRETAQTILKDYKGIFPKNYSEIRSLKGIGDYTASAIASFAYDLPHAVVDGNVYRVLSRIFGLKDAIDSSAGKKKFSKLAATLIDVKNPGLYNQAIMEFGSQFCRPVNPDCANCPFKTKCYAFINNKINALPYKSKKTKVRDRFLNYLVVADKKNHIVLNKRSENDIWKGLYEFILIEKDKESGNEEFLNSGEFMNGGFKNPDVLFVSKTYRHELTHRRLFAKFYVMRVHSNHSKKNKLAKANSLTNFAFPRLIEKFLNDCNLSELL